MSETPIALTPSGPLAVPPRALVELLGLSASFQARVGVSRPADALRFIFRPWQISLEGEPPQRPAAIVSRRKLLLRRVSAYHLRPTEDNALNLTLTDWDRFPQDVELSASDFESFVGGVIADLAELQARDTNLAIQTIGMEGDDGPLFTHPTEQIAGKNYWLANIRVGVSPW